MDAINYTASGFTSALANAKYPNVNIPPQLDYVVDAISNAGVWTLAFTFIAMCIVYDQRAFLPFSVNPQRSVALTSVLSQSATS